LRTIHLSQHIPSENDSRNRPRHQSQHLLPLRVATVDDERTEISDDQQRQAETDRVLRLEQYLENGDIENAQAGNAAFAHSYDQSGEREHPPPPQLEIHGTKRAIGSAMAIAKQA